MKESKFSTVGQPTPGSVAAGLPPSPEELELQREMDDLTDADYMSRDDGE
jgi:hypothetical protein